jgi:hypothetical protein
MALLKLALRVAAEQVWFGQVEPNQPVVMKAGRSAARFAIRRALNMSVPSEPGATVRYATRTSIGNTKTAPSHDQLGRI